MTPGNADDSREARLLSVLRRAGHRLTRSRRAVWAALAATESHLAAVDVLERARAREPSVSLSSVYRALRLFTAVRLVRPVFLGEAGQRFARVDGGHHDHLLCDRCGRVFEITDCPLAGAPETVWGRQGFRVRGHLLEIYGTCDHCSPG